jgi:hypothetical protein
MNRFDMRDILNSQKTNISRMLNWIQDQGFYAICAGGFPRDYILYQKGLGSKKARDFDIYIASSDRDKDLIKIMKKKAKAFEKLYESYDESINDVKAVYTGQFINSKNDSTFDKFELIFVETDDVRDYVFDKFDLSICQAYYDGEEFKTSKAFKDTLRTKTITYNTELSEDLVEYSFRKHVPKMLKKFGGEFFFDLPENDHKKEIVKELLNLDHQKQTRKTRPGYYYGRTFPIPNRLGEGDFTVVARTKITEKLMKNKRIIQTDENIVVRT